VWKYDNPKSQKHIEDSYTDCAQLYDVYDGEVTMKLEGQQVRLGKQPFIHDDGIVGSAIQLSGPTTLNLCPYTAKNQVNTISIFGNIGSGKSYFTGEYMRQFRKLYPESKILVFSRKSDEPAFTEQYQQVDVEADSFLDNPITTKDVRKMHEQKGEQIPVLAIFDDVSTFDKKTLKAVLHTRDDFIKVGRSLGIHVIVTNHIISDGLLSKTLHNMSSHTVYFLKNQKSKVEQALKDRQKFKPDVIDFLVDLPTRWICITDSLIITQSSVFTQDGLCRYLKLKNKKK